MAWLIRNPRACVAMLTNVIHVLCLMQLPAVLTSQICDSYVVKCVVTSPPHNTTKEKYSRTQILKWSVPPEPLSKSASGAGSNLRDLGACSD